MKTKRPTENTITNPFVSIVIPSHKKYPQFKKDELVLKKMIDEAETKISKQFGKKVSGKIISSLNAMKTGLDYKHMTDGLVLHCSPEDSKIYRLSFRPEEKLIINSSFEIRDILYSLKGHDNFAVLVLSEQSVRVILNTNGSTEELVIPELPFGKKDTGGEGHSKTQKYSSGSSTKHVSDLRKYDETRINKYLLDIDKIISKLEELKNASLIVCAPVRMLGHFKSITKNKSRIIGWIKGNYEKDSEQVILSLCDNVLKAHHQKKQGKILDLIEKEHNKKRLAWGIRDVHRAAIEGKGHLLVIEKDFVTPQVKPKNKTEKAMKSIPKDIADDVVERVLEFGGDVEFVENGSLTEFGRIALIKRY